MNDIEIGVLQPEERAAYEAIVSQALHFDPAYAEWWINQIGRTNFRVARHAGQVVAGLGIIPMGQWFGGQRVPSAGITAVAVRLDFRGQGVGRALLQSVLSELNKLDTPLSALYPSSLGFYRGVGYERAGTRLDFEAPMQALAQHERSLPVIPITPDEEGILYQVYAEYARCISAGLDRSPFIWQRILHPSGIHASAYLIGAAGEPQGYVVLSQGRRDEPLLIRDSCFLTKAAGWRMQALIAAQQTMIDRVAWHGSPHDAFTYLLPEQKARITRTMDWMLRIVDVEQALAIRGYPQSASGTLHLAITDDTLPSNHGRFMLDVSAGKGRLKRGGTGSLQLSVRDLAALYTGHIEPAMLQRVGTLEGDSDTLVFANVLFCSQRPGLADMF